MDVVSGFNHQNPGDNNKPMIYHKGEDTYVLNKTARTDGQPLYYGVGQFGRNIKAEVISHLQHDISSLTL